MQATKTTPEHLVSEKVETKDIMELKFMPGSLNVHVSMHDAESDDRNVIVADMSQEWDGWSQTKKNEWNNVMKKIVAKALGITAGEISGDLWT